MSNYSNSSSTASEKKIGDPSSRRWNITLPFSEYGQAEVESFGNKYMALIGQLEEGEQTGYKHWQLYLEHKNAVRRSTLKKAFPKGHFEKATLTRVHAIKYVTKPDTYAGVRISMGKLDLTVRQGKRTDLDSYLEQMSLEGKTASQIILEDHRAVKYAGMLDRLQLERDRAEWADKFRDIEVHYIYGSSRNGKTSAIYETYGKPNVARVVSYDENPFDVYYGQEVLVLDEFRSSLQISQILTYLEGYYLELPARYANKVAKFSKVFIITNIPLEEQYQNVQRESAETWRAFKNRLTSVSRMVLTEVSKGDEVAELVVESGTAPQLDHLLAGKPVVVVPKAEYEPLTPFDEVVEVSEEAAAADEAWVDRAWRREVLEEVVDLEEDDDELGLAESDDDEFE